MLANAVKQLHKGLKVSLCTKTLEVFSRIMFLRAFVVPSFSSMLIIKLSTATCSPETNLISAEKKPPFELAQKQSFIFKIIS